MANVDNMTISLKPCLHIWLKAKVKKYREHSEAKEEHYKSEYSRLENEFRNTLETLRLRVESAYCSKATFLSF